MPGRSRGRDWYPGFRSPARLPSHAPHFVRDHVPHGSGSRIRTTLDLDLQGLVEARIAEHVERRRRDGIANAAAMLVDARRMEVLALVGSAGFFDTAIAGQVNGVRAPRSPGSTLKPPLYALAMDAGLIHPMTLLEDAPRRYAAYTPENFDRGFLGPVFARDALVYSRNVPAVGLLAELGVERFRDWLRGAGVTDLRPAADYGLALALGGSEITMEELTRLYAALAGGGLWRDVTVVPGSVPSTPRRVLSEEASLPGAGHAPRRRDGPTRLHGFSANDRRLPGRPARRLASGTPGASGSSATTCSRSGSATSTAAPIRPWLAAKPPHPLFFAIADGLPAPEGRRRVAPGGPPLVGRAGRACRHPPGALNLRRVEVCATTGDLPGPHCPRTTRSWFIPRACRPSGCRRSTGLST